MLNLSRSASASASECVPASVEAKLERTSSFIEAFPGTLITYSVMVLPTNLGGNGC